MEPALERAELAAVRTIYLGLPDARVSEVAGWTVMTWPRRPDVPWMHRAAAAGPVPDGSLDLVLPALGRRGGVIEVCAGAVPAAELRSRGLVASLHLMRVVAATGGRSSAGEAPRTPLWLETVGPPGGGDVASVARQGFGLDEPWWWVAPLGAPGWTQVVAYADDVPVGTGALHAAGKVAWVGAATTIPAARGRGVQAALLAHRMALAAELGATRVTAKAVSGSGSLRNLMRAGFEAGYDVVQWRARASSTPT